LLISEKIGKTQQDRDREKRERRERVGETDREEKKVTEECRKKETTRGIEI
jgi:hypothetical protein